MELGVAFPARTVGERRHRPTFGGHPPPYATGLYPGHGGPFLQERQRLGDGLPVSGGHHLGHRIGGEGPQQRDALGCRKGHIESPHRAFPVPRQQLGTAHRVASLDQRPQLLRLDYPRQPELFCPFPGPHPR